MPCHPDTRKRITRLALPAAKAVKVDAILAAGSVAEVKVQMEVLEVTGAGRAVLWIEDPEGAAPPRLAAAALGARRAAELALILEAGRVPVIEIVFEVIGRDRHGHAAAVSGREGRVRVQAPAAAALAA